MTQCPFNAFNLKFWYRDNDTFVRLSTLNVLRQKSASDGRRIISLKHINSPQFESNFWTNQSDQTE